MVPRTLVLSLLLCLTPLGSKSQDKPAPASDPNLGSVRGVVLDMDGFPVANAWVYVAGAISRNAPTALTDDEGKFTLDRLSGQMGLFAYKPADGYPYNFAAFFHTAEEKFALVEVSPGSVVEGVVLRFGPKAARIDFDISDEKGAPVNAGVAFIRPDMPEIGKYGPGISAKESMLVPAVPLRLTVEADGYEPWHYGGEEWQTDKGLIKLKPSETLALSVRLKHLE